MAKVIIVDENDNVIGSKERGTVDPVNDASRITGLWVTNSKGQILLAQRKWNKKYNPGKWGPAAGGTVEEGETYESNIYKEAEEEIGLKGEKFETGIKYFSTVPNRRFAQVFTLVTDKPIEYFKIQEAEVEQIKWFDKEELLSELKNNPDNFSTAVHKLTK